MDRTYLPILLLLGFVAINAVAMLADYPCPALVIDFGTATTFDVINEKGHFSGGVIAPGPNLSMVALHQAAAQLPKVSVSKPPTTMTPTKALLSMNASRAGSIAYRGASVTFRAARG